jgi:hypothetical protein
VLINRKHRLSTGPPPWRWLTPYGTDIAIITLATILTLVVAWYTL